MNIQTENKIKVPFVDFKSRYALYRQEILHAVDEVFSSGAYILGDFVEKCEQAIGKHLECPYVLTVANGTDALVMALKALGVGRDDEVIVPVNSFIASAGAVAMVGAKLVFCDVTEDLNIDVKQIEKCISKKTKAIIPVHLTGRPANMAAIQSIAKHHQLVVIEDAAQCIGATYQNQFAGTIGDIGCFSLHPLKNLYVYGDGGFITTRNPDLYHHLKRLRNHGLIDRDHCAEWGLNSRLDSVQANIVLHGLEYLKQWTQKRQHNAKCYRDALSHLVTVPTEHQDLIPVYHNFVILTKQRDALAAFLQEEGIESKVHYPIPLHLQQAAKSLNYRLGDFPVAERLAKEMLSLPVYPELSAEQLNYVINKIQEFFHGC
ncbi:MAG: hypothetical protein A3F12_00500 [Gammaproteobacteria bacterium RIFCSPHIGHO2_12_FULL_38_14]|nr:MAG: hypothetical protein A3F12_00500 [Gammaproteobacteria bacterium RIFCSPHIGHO2_12_FULL_38_14]